MWQIMCCKRNEDTDWELFDGKMKMIQENEVGGMIDQL